MLYLFGIKNCDNVRRTAKFLKTNQINYIFHDFRESPVNKSIIQSWIDAGATVKELFNTRGTRYRTLKLKEHILSDDDKIEWMAKENMLIKRPVLMLSGTVVVGYNEKQMHQLFPDQVLSK